MNTAKKPKLPAWAVLDEKHADERLAVVDIDAEVAYKTICTELQKAFPGGGAMAFAMDQFWLQVAHEFIKMDVQLALAGTDFDPRVSGKVAQNHISSAPDYEQARYPKGLGHDAASKGQMARKIYAQVRGLEALRMAVE